MSKKKAFIQTPISNIVSQPSSNGRLLCVSSRNKLASEKLVSGFTLVELLVVISIIAMLLAILIPSLNKARQSGQRVVCATHQKTIGLANQIYANSWNGSYVPLLDATVPKPSDATGSYTYYCWVANKAFRSYLNFDKVKKEKYVKSTGSYETGTIFPNEFYCPSDEVAKQKKVSSKGVLVSFGYNATGWEDQFNKFNWVNPTHPLNVKFVGYKATDIKSPVSKIAFIDSVDWYVFWDGANYKYYWDKYGQINPDDYLSKASVSGVVTYRHNEGANILFYDGHASYMKKDKVYINAYPTQPPRFWKDATGMWSTK
jgi:prepilin-type processing-associated H-X9-DG protein/prepilin-type N-terminal cleavage/methylation domain-containing protein